jgi:hypothetical protein
MSKTVLLLAVLFALAAGYKTCRYESGSESSVHWAPKPYHILHTGNKVPRSVDVTIKFKKAFDDEPKVAIANYLLDWQLGSPSGYIITVVKVTTEDFVIRYSAVSPRQLYSVYTNWLAVIDPRIHVQWYETTELGPLKTGEGARETIHKVPIQGFQFDAAPIGIAFLTGV